MYSFCCRFTSVHLIAASILNKFLICFSCHHLEIQSINIFKPPTHVLSGEKASNNNLVLQAVKPHNTLKSSPPFLYNNHIKDALSSLLILLSFSNNDSVGIFQDIPIQGIAIFIISVELHTKLQVISRILITPFQTNSKPNIIPSHKKG
jgi:hypothetical protein